MILLTAIEAVIILIVFLYLVHLVSHIRNILRAMMARIIMNEIDAGKWDNSNKLTPLRQDGIITGHQQSVLSMMIANKKKLDTDETA
ncbi:MAG: hypothetical protein GWO10_16355 [candidate division Zixibacteria bacterium]|nr:hypothetical protein [Gammaproteobacteria bacterium]NIR25705.1 hypothetical protein [Gammaproteobacteria bacterium]NIR65298.1 hypothetical protein [candidate division Zixibacteria bacterium]NIS52342.1 hypothetical protein [Phycisphaerae bacterium]NIX02141.1 hypothetical protein [Phycisphaerae bacterium]